MAYLFNHSIDLIRHILTKHGKPGWVLSSQPAHLVDLSEIAKAPKDVRNFGCDPSFDAYKGGEPKYSMVDGGTHNIRYAGGHMHFSVFDAPLYESEFGFSAFPELVHLLHPPNYPQLVKWLDLKVGLPLSFIFGDEHEFQRRKVYGQAGEFRPQTYPWVGITKWDDGYSGVPKTAHHILKGLEYRVPGPQMYNHPAILHAAFGTARNTLEKCMSWRWDPAIEDDLQGAINTGEGALALLESEVWHREPNRSWNLEGLLYLREKFRAGDPTISFLNQDNWRLECHHGWNFHTRDSLPTRPEWTGLPVLPSWPDMPVWK
jgi:hypothetical protein